MDLCDSKVRFGEQGFLTCINPKCGIIYKDKLICQQNGDIMVQMTIRDRIQQDVVCQRIHC